jgi:cation transport regulator
MPGTDRCDGLPSKGVPYDDLSDLPESVRNNLPRHAQEIYRAAFNSAEEQQYGE